MAASHHSLVSTSPDLEIMNGVLTATNSSTTAHCKSSGELIVKEKYSCPHPNDSTRAYPRGSAPPAPGPEIDHHSQACYFMELDRTLKTDRSNLLGTIASNIICNIFEHYRDSKPRPRENDSPEDRRASMHDYNPTALQLVCRKWWKVAPYVPRLWSRISIRFSAGKKPEACHVQYVKISLERSRTEPLDLRICCNYVNVGNGYVEDDEPLSQILKEFVLRLEYWQKIHFWIPALCWRPLYQIVKSPEMPRMPRLLKDAFIGFDTTLPDIKQYSFLDDVDAIWNTLHGSPELQKVEWGYCFKFKHRQLLRHAPFKQLTHLVCNFLELSIDNVLSILGRLPLIQNLSIGDIERKVPPSKSSPRTTFPLRVQHLRTLHISSEISIDSLFSRIRCPSLDSLSISHWNEQEPTFFDFSSLLSFLQNSRCQLKRFSMKGGSFSEDALIKLITSDTFRLVNDLKIKPEHYVISDKVVEILMKKIKDGFQFLVLLEDITLFEDETRNELLKQQVLPGHRRLVNRSSP